MKKTIRIKKLTFDWLKVFPKLVYEIGYFLLNIPRYLLLFFSGLRISANSYSKLLGAIQTTKNAIDRLFENKPEDPQQTTRLFRSLLNEQIRLGKEQEKLFTALFGVFVAILALLISIITLLIKR